jgi:signal transduction histidine kinase/ligand-binding sensor domain-containing protein
MPPRPSTSPAARTHLTSVAARRALVLLCLLSLLPADAPTPARASGKEISEQPASLHQWGAVTLFHGLPSDQVRAVAQDSDGVMWFGTDAGLARYDGRRVQTVKDEGLSGPRVRALAADAGGALWVGTDGGAYVRAAGAQEFRRVEGTEGKSVLAVAAPARGRALLATADGLLLECLQADDGSLNVRQLGERLTASTGKGQPLALTSIVTAGDALVVGTRGRGLLVVDEGGEAKEVVSKPRAFFVETLARGHEGALFFGAQTSASDSGLFRTDDAHLARPSKLAGGATGTVTALGVAPGGDLYAATDGRGVFRYGGDGRLVEHFTFAGTAGGLRSDRVNAVFVDREGVVWFGTPRGVCRYDPRGVRVEQLSEEAEGNFVRTLYRTSRGRLLAGTSRGLFVGDDASGAWREVEEVKGKTVYALAEDGAGLLLVGTSAGLYVGLQAEERAPRAGVRLAPEEKPAAEQKNGEKPAGESKRDARRAGEKRRAVEKKDGGQAAARKSAGVQRSSEEERASQSSALDSSASDSSAPGSSASGSSGSNSSASQSSASSSDESSSSSSDESDSTDESAPKKSAEPALSGSVRAIARFGDAVYVATFGRGLERFEGPGRRTLIWPRAGDDERGREVVSLYADSERGRLWVGTANVGVFYFDGRAVKAEPALAPLAASTVWGAAGADGWLWLATSRGLFAFREGRPLVEVAHDVDARAVAIATEANDSSTTPSTSSTAPSGGDSSNANDAASSTPHSLPRAWCATAGAGVLRVALDEQFGPVTSRLDTEQGLPSDGAFAVLAYAANDGGGASLLVGTTRGLARYEPGGLAPALRLTRVAASRAYQPEELRGGALRLDYPQNSIALDVDASDSRTFPEQFQYAFTLLDSRGRTVKQKLSHDSQFQADGLPAGRYRITARAYTLDLTPSAPLAFDFEVASAPFPRTTVALSVLLALALVALAWAYLEHRRILRSREALREANRQLAAARLQLASEAESERRRIARDLHDQTLADLRRLLLLTDEMQSGGLAPVAGMTATSGVAAAASGPTAGANDSLARTDGDASGAGVGAPGALAGASGGALQTVAFDPAALRAEIEAISQEVRRICEDLSPSVLENVGFAAALEFALASALAHLPAEHKFTYEFTCDESLEERLALAPGAQMQVYRIVQEAVSNVCRHARAAHVRLTIHLDEDGLFTLTLEDDGRGFDAANRKALKGRGLAGIRARASLVEAEVEWRRREGGGTVFVLRKKSAGKKEATSDALHGD